MALCSYSTLLSQTTPCGQSSDYPCHFDCVALKDCKKDITGHLAGHKLTTDEGIGTEMKLLLARACKYFCNSTNINVPVFLPTYFELEIIILSYQKMFSGIFTVEESHHTLNICPRHRADFGIRWRTRKTLCTVPRKLAVHKCPSAKESCRANSQQSKNIFKNTGILIPVGSRKLIIF